MKKYTALTIGPIIKSLGLAHKTRELWAASYFFSALMEKVIENLKKNNAVILPFPDKKELKSQLKIGIDEIQTAGVFPDRIILESKDGLYKQLEEAVDNSINSLIKDFGIECQKSDLKDYLSTHIIEFDFKARELFDKEGNPVEDNVIYQANDFLANCELQASYSAIDKGCFLRMLESIAETKFYKSKFSRGISFILEIAAQGLTLDLVDFDDNEFEDDTIWEQIEKQNPDVKKHHKYIAIVQADGDNVGSIIKEVAKQGSKEILEFSKALSSFSLVAAKEIEKYRGLPIYTGGDDLLFFAPVSNEKENIFQLIDRLDALFKKYVSDLFKTDPIATMSYGLSISYYKFPMHEALDNARKLLFEDAKSGNKDAIAYKVTLHSGQVFETILQKKSAGSIMANELFSGFLDEDKGLLINSLMYGFEKHKTLLKESLKDETNAKLTNFFTNFYNEDIHKESQDFILKVKNLLQNSYKHNGKDVKKTLSQVYAQLRFVKFLNTTKDD